MDRYGRRSSLAEHARLLRRRSSGFGDHMLPVPVVELHRENRRRLCQRLRESANDSQLTAGALVLMKGAEMLRRHDTWFTYEFRQESYFHWTFGVSVPDCFGCIEVDTGRCTIFFPREDPDFYHTWMGQPLTSNCFKSMFGVDEAHYIDQMVDFLDKISPSVVLLLDGVNPETKCSVQPTQFEGMTKFTLDSVTLYPAITECRVFKSELELEVMRYSSRICVEAHKAVMAHVRPGMKEFHLDSIFRHFCTLMGGCRSVSYTSICASGANCAYISYGHPAAPNNKTIRDGDMCAMNMGTEYYCYAADVGTAFPANGRFTEEQKIIHNIILNTCTTVKNAMKPGVSYVWLHQLASRTSLQQLKQHGLLQGDVDEMMQVNLYEVFQPHGLGHLMGCDVVDVGGLVQHRSQTDRLQHTDGVKHLWMDRTLEKDMVVTAEPGCYFIDYALKQALADERRGRFLVPEVIDRFKSVGGVRIEDVMVITEDGVECITEGLPRTVEEIEEFMAESRRGPYHFADLFARITHAKHTSLASFKRSISISEQKEATER